MAVNKDAKGDLTSGSWVIGCDLAFCGDDVLNLPLLAVTTASA